MYYFVLCCATNYFKSRTLSHWYHGVPQNLSFVYFGYLWVVRSYSVPLLVLLYCGMCHLSKFIY